MWINDPTTIGAAVIITFLLLAFCFTSMRKRKVEDQNVYAPSLQEQVEALTKRVEALEAKQASTSSVNSDSANKARGIIGTKQVPSPKLLEHQEKINKSVNLGVQR